MRFAFLIALSALALPSSAGAELAFFANGRSMSVRDHRIEDDTLVLSRRGGGEVTFRTSDIVRFAPDEVPYPEPETESAAVQPEPPVDSRPYVELVDQISTKHGVDPRLVKAVIQVESNYK